MKKWWNTNWATRDNFENFVIYVLEKYTWSYIFKKLNPITNVKIFINFVRLSSPQILYTLIKVFSAKDYLWEHAKRRFFFVKLRYFLMLVFFSYIALGYMYDAYLQRQVQTNDTGDIWLCSKKEYDLQMYCKLVPPKLHSDVEQLSYYTFFGERFTIAHWLDMWIHLVAVSFMLCLFFFLSIFFRSIHEAIYNKRMLLIGIGSVFAFVQGFDDYFMIVTSYHIILFSWIPYYVFYFFNQIYWTVLAAVYEDPDDYADTWILNFIFRLPPAPTFEDWLVLPDIEPYDGGLHTIPNVYSLDPDFEANMLIEQRKKRHADVVEGGTLYDIYHDNFIRIDFSLSLTENIVNNFVKVARYNWYGIATVFSGWAETFSEFMHRYYKSLEVLGKKDYGFNAMDFIIKSPYEEMIMDPWFEEERYIYKEDENRKDYFLREHYTAKGRPLYLGTNKWFMAFPILFRWCYLLYWFYKEYRLCLKYSAYCKKRGIRKYICFWPSFLRFFGFQLADEPKIFRFSGGYILYDILPHVFLMDHERFDWDLYTAPDVQYGSIKAQVRSLLIRSYNNIIYFILNFFGTYEFWLSVLQFWKKDSISRKFLFSLFIRFFDLCVMLVIFIILSPYRAYKIIIFIHQCFFNILWLFYYLQIIYWSFLVNCVYGIRLLFVIVFKNPNDVGRFKYFNCSPWKDYRVEKFWQNFILLFKRRIPKSFKLSPRRSFLVWSKKWK